MKHLCFSRYITIVLLLCSSLFGALHDKSAIVYYGEKISYPMVGIHDYIIVQANRTNTKTHGFDVYKENMYAYVSIGEIDRDIPEYSKINQEWIVAQNKAWKSDVLDINNKEYQKFLFEEMIEPNMKKGFKNFFFDTLDSYHLAAKTLEEKKKSEESLVLFIKTFHEKYPNSKLIINRGFEIIERVHEYVDALLFESYYKGLGGKGLVYRDVPLKDRLWLDNYLEKVKSYGLDIIAVDYLEYEQLDKAAELIKKIQLKEMIPYVSTKELDIYGKSTKNAIKREVLTLIDERTKDRISSSAHLYGALPLEYMGYIQRLHDVSSNPLPDIKNMRQYAGVIVWLSDVYKDEDFFVNWLLDVRNAGIKIAFADSFSINNSINLKRFDIEVDESLESRKNEKRLTYKDTMIGYEIEPSISTSLNYIKPKNAKPLLTFTDSSSRESTIAAITPWGGYALSESFMIELAGDNIWVINPFKFFEQALRLKPLIVPDVTTQNGKRLLFTHIDGDGIMNRVEWNPTLFSGDVILSEILKEYKVPHSVSIIGAEISPQGMYPELSNQLENIAREMYKLENVEAATHTFSHPFFWNKIKNDTLSEEYRLKVKGYNFSLDNELKGTLSYINTELTPKDKVATKTIFWSGDCAPTEVVLKNVYENGFLNINGGDTYISNTNPWLSYIAPLGLERGEYYQIYTGAQNENVYTNDWLGPFWGFKKVIQTFKLTDSPKRLKPIDIYYHLYSGSKKASLNALKYVFDWSIAQDVFPIYTSEYIPKVMDYYSVSMAQEGSQWLFSGMQDLKTLRIEKKDAKIDFGDSDSVLGYKHFENHTYVHLGKTSSVYVKEVNDVDVDTKPYLISANAKIVQYERDESRLSMSFNGFVDLKVAFHVPKSCKVRTDPKIKYTQEEKNILIFEGKNIMRAKIDVDCK